MESKPQRNLFDIACISSAAGLLLYWAMFMTILPRLMRPYATTMLPILSGLIGFVSCALSAIGFLGIIASAKSKPKPQHTFVLRRGEEGRVVSIGWARAGYVTKTEATRANRTHPILKTPVTRKHKKTKWLVGVPLLIVGVLSSYVTLMTVMGYTAQDFANGMYSPIMVVSSQSMQPVLNYGDLILVRKEPVERIAVGDIIAFNVPSPYDTVAQSPTVHTVIEKSDDAGEVYFKTKGDSNPNEDQWNVPAKNVIGKYAGKIPYIGLVVVLLRNPLSLPVISVLIILSFIYPHFKKKGGENP